MFKQTFKHYKRKCPESDVQDVIDLDLYEPKNSSHSWYTVSEQKLVKPVNLLENNTNQDLLLPVGLKPQNMWRCYMLLKHPGLLVIRNPFTLSGQRYWIARSLRDYPQAPNIANLDANVFSPAALSNWWQELHQCTDKNVANRLKLAMRWTTLGYHHNWDTKVYNEEMHTKFPRDLSSMCQFFALVLGYTDFIPQAAIINYYPIGTNLSGHTDHSEPNHAAPLFSYSFGQTAIFLIGGTTLEEKPTALYLRSGDVLIMSGESRLCYHAVPRIMKTHTEPWNELDVSEDKCKETTITDINTMSLELTCLVTDEHFWNPFDRYINDSRININVRQVLLSV